MTRTDNIKKNLTFNFIKFAAQLVLQFIVRTVLIYVMGAEYLGLNGLFSNIFNFLNLAELGIGSAIVFSMYKPIAEGDVEQVKSLQSMYKKFYMIIAAIVAGIGILLLPLLKFLIRGDVPSDINIYLLYILYLINTLIGYFSAHKRSLLFAHQRNDVENKIFTICLLGMNIVQIVSLILLKNYYIYFLVNIVFTFIECILIHVWANKLYPEINGEGKPLDVKIKRDIYSNVKSISIHRIGSTLVFATDNIIISAMLGLVILGVYSNYYLIITALISMFNLFVYAIKGSVGNLIACRDKEYVFTKYKQINMLFSIMSAFCTVCLIVLFQSFIKIWTNSNETYLLNYSSVILLCLSFYLSRMRITNTIFKECAGIFKQDTWKAIVEAVVNLVASIGLGFAIGLNGIILGTIISTIVAPLWVEPWVLYKHYFKKGVWDYFKQYLIDTLIMVTCAVICYFICSFIPDENIWLLIAKFAVCITLCALLLFVAYIPFKDFRDCVAFIKDFVKNIFSKKVETE